MCSKKGEYFRSGETTFKKVCWNWEYFPDSKPPQRQFDLRKGLLIVMGAGCYGVKLLSTELFFTSPSCVNFPSFPKVVYPRSFARLKKDVSNHQPRISFQRKVRCNFLNFVIEGKGACCLLFCSRSQITDIFILIFSSLTTYIKDYDNVHKVGAWHYHSVLWIVWDRGFPWTASSFFIGPEGRLTHRLISLIFFVLPFWVC